MGHSVLGRANFTLDVNVLKTASSPVFPASSGAVFPRLPETLGEEQGGLRSQRGGEAELEDGDGLGAEASVPAELGG